MFKIGEKVIFVGECNLIYGSEHIVKIVRYDMVECVYFVWVEVNFPFTEFDFVTIKQYRKLKLEKIKLKYNL